MTTTQRFWLVCFISSLFTAMMCTIIVSVIVALPSIALAIMFGLLFVYPYEEEEEN